jgi:hypothetical protein
VNLCIGAVSRRVVEVAADLQVYQIVASRGQVDVGGGYTGLDQEDLVSLVRSRSLGVTKIIRDHGGPLQGREEDDGIESFQADVDAGFDGLHIDVCKLPEQEQPAALVKLVDRFGDQGVTLEIGGEHDPGSWTEILLDAVVKETEYRPDFVVLDTGSHVWAESQVGDLHKLRDVERTARHLRSQGIKTKAHNMDWVGDRVRRYRDAVDAYNIAPEFARLETDALLTVLDDDDAYELLSRAFESGAWHKWFNNDEGTWFDRARCAVHYVQEDRALRGLIRLSEGTDQWVRGVIGSGIAVG